MSMCVARVVGWCGCVPVVDECVVRGVRWVFCAWEWLVRLLVGGERASFVWRRWGLWFGLSLGRVI